VGGGWATSSSPAEAHVVLQALGLAGQFDVVVTAADVVRAKPAPDLYLLATARLAVTPQQAIAVEDSSSGLQAALAAGVTCIGMATSSSRGQDHAGAAWWCARWPSCPCTGSGRCTGWRPLRGPPGHAARCPQAWLESE